MFWLIRFPGQGSWVGRLALGDDAGELAGILALSVIAVVVAAGAGRGRRGETLASGFALGEGEHLRCRLERDVLDRDARAGGVAVLLVDALQLLASRLDGRLLAYVGRLRTVVGLPGIHERLPLCPIGADDRRGDDRAVLALADCLDEALLAVTAAVGVREDGQVLAVLLLAGHVFDRARDHARGIEAVELTDRHAAVLHDDLIDGVERLP